VAINRAENEKLSINDIDPEVLSKLKANISIGTIDEGASYYITSMVSFETGEIEGRGSMYLRKDGFFYRNCGPHGFYDTKEEAEKAIDDFFGGAEEIVVYKDGRVINEHIFKRYRISDG